MRSRSTTTRAACTAAGSISSGWAACRPTRARSRRSRSRARPACRYCWPASCAGAEEQRYFDDEVQPRLGGGIAYVGEIDLHERVRLLHGAHALINPLAWDEPFGLVMAEAMACGVPVIATPRGSVPGDRHPGPDRLDRRRPSDEMAAAVGRCREIDPSECRAIAERLLRARAHGLPTTWTPSTASSSTPSARRRCAAAPSPDAGFGPPEAGTTTPFAPRAPGERVHAPVDPHPVVARDRVRRVLRVLAEGRSGRRDRAAAGRRPRRLRHSAAAAPSRNTRAGRGARASVRAVGYRRPSR